MATEVNPAALEEYRALKAEQVVRIGTRDNLIYATLVAVAAVGYSALQSGVVALLLAIPPAMVILGWIYTDNDRKIANIRTYIRTQLAMQVLGIDAFGWESPGPPSPWRVAASTTVRLMLFAGPAVAAVATWAALTGRPLPILVAAATVETVATALLVAAILRATK